MTRSAELHLEASAYANRRRDAYLGRMKQGLAEELSEEMLHWLWVAHYEGWRDAIQETKHGY